MRKLSLNSFLLSFLIYSSFSNAVATPGQISVESCKSTIRALQSYIGGNIAVRSKKTGCRLTSIDNETYLQDGFCYGKGTFFSSVNFTTQRLYVKWTPEDFENTFSCDVNPLIDKQRFTCQRGIDQMRNDASFSSNMNFAHGFANRGCPRLGLRGITEGDGSEPKNGVCYAIAYWVPHGRAYVGIRWDVDKDYNQTLRCFDLNKETPFNQ